MGRDKGWCGRCDDRRSLHFRL